MKQYWIVLGSLVALTACGGAQTADQSVPGAQASMPASSPSDGGERSGNEPSASSNDNAAGQDAQADASSQASTVSRTSPAAGASEGDAQRAEVPPLPAGTKVLHIGDSFAGALGLPLGALFEAASVKSVLKHTDASYLTDWAWNGELQKYLWKYNPDLLIITLGANELAITEPEQREKTIKKITSIVGDRPCLWVAIPLWQGKHNGLMDVIQKNAGPCVYWDSNALLDVENMARISDGIHPTSEARAAWAQVVFDWLRQHRKVDSDRPWQLRP